jgi:uncharacterized protein (DUF1330 family)
VLLAYPPHPQFAGRNTVFPRSSNRRETVNGRLYCLHARKDAQSEAHDRYREAARPAAAGHPLKPLAPYGKQEILEGATIEGAVILEFPTIEAAKAYYYSPDYQDAAQHRFLGADYRVFIVEGL